MQQMKPSSYQPPDHQPSSAGYKLAHVLTFLLGLTIAITAPGLDFIPVTYRVVVIIAAALLMLWSAFEAFTTYRRWRSVERFTELELAHRRKLLTPTQPRPRPMIFNMNSRRPAAPAQVDSIEEYDEPEPEPAAAPIVAEPPTRTGWGKVIQLAKRELFDDEGVKPEFTSYQAAIWHNYQTAQQIGLTRAAWAGRVKRSQYDQIMREFTEMGLIIGRSGRNPGTLAPTAQARATIKKQRPA
jgi:hypothetical protein